MKFLRVVLILAVTWMLVKLVAGDVGCAGMASTTCENPRATMAVMAVLLLFVWGIVRVLRWRKEE